MDSGSISDFVKQVPIWIILAPVVLAVLYGVMMLVILQRARERRRKRNPNTAPTASPTNFSPDGTLLTPAYPQPAFAGGVPSASQPHAVPARIAQISTSEPMPEPDFDDLIQSMSTPTPMPPPPIVAKSAPPIPPPQFESPAADEPQPMTGATGDAVEVMRILRDLSTGKLIVEIGGRQYSSPGDIPNIEQARRFQSIVRELNAMITPASVTNATPIRRPVAETGAALPDIKVSLTPPAPVESPLAIRRGAAASPDAQNRGIADQIENYLQYKLANTPEFQHRSIHIRPTDEGGVLIEVEGQVFHGLDTITDPEVRTFLNSTLREWEARQ